MKMTVQHLSATLSAVLNQTTLTCAALLATERMGARDKRRSDSMERVWTQSKGNTETFIISPQN